MWPDVEDVLTELLSPIGYTTTVLPDPKEWSKLIKSHGCLIAVNRVGGGKDIDRITDTAVVAFLTIGKDRQSAHSYADQVVDALFAAEATAPGGWLIDAVRESEANVEQYPEFSDDDRYVTGLYEFDFRQRWQ